MEEIKRLASSYFVEVCLPSGRIVLGIVSELDFGNWKSGSNSILKLQYPQSLHPMQGQDGHVKIVIVPSHITDTKQETLYVNPEDIEVIGELDVERTTCSESNSLYQNYLSALDNRRAALAGIITPTGANKDNIINMSKLPKPKV